MIERVGEIRTGVTAYCDPLQETMGFLIGYKSEKINFVVGNSADINDYIKALQHYEERTKVKTVKL